MFHLPDLCHSLKVRTHRNLQNFNSPSRSACPGEHVPLPNSSLHGTRVVRTRHLGSTPGTKTEELGRGDTAGTWPSSFPPQRISGCTWPSFARTWTPGCSRGRAPGPEDLNVSQAIGKTVRQLRGPHPGSGSLHVPYSSPFTQPDCGCRAAASRRMGTPRAAKQCGKKAGGARRAVCSRFQGCLCRSRGRDGICMD